MVPRALTLTQSRSVNSLLESSEGQRKAAMIVRLTVACSTLMFWPLFPVPGPEYPTVPLAEKLIVLKSGPCSICGRIFTVQGHHDPPQPPGLAMSLTMEPGGKLREMSW
jgi:hypothetical protein